MKRKTWEKTRLQNLVRHKSGRYYARAFAGGKEVWKSLKTSHFSVAEARLAEFLKEHRERRANSKSEGSEKMTFGQAASIHLRNLDDNQEIKQSTRDFWHRCLDTLYKSWPGLEQTPVRKITKLDCDEWARRYAKTVSGTWFNNTLAILRHILTVAVHSGVLYGNPALTVKRVKIRTPAPELPSSVHFRALIPEMRNGCSRDSENCADLAAGLAFTGCRISELREVAWKDLDFDAGEIVVRGDSQTGTKNWEVRRVPMIADARLLFERMRSERPKEFLTEKVFRVRVCQKSLDRSARKIGMTRITHHDLRHLFATRCIESGVDIPTVSRWLGHKDGGALAMKTYGHLRREHSIAQAQRVTFAPVVTKQADVIPFPAKA
jgi:integrase